MGAHEQIKELINFLRRRELGEKCKEEKNLSELNVMMDKYYDFQVESKGIKQHASSIEGKYRLLREEITLYERENSNLLEKLNLLQKQNIHLRDINNTYKNNIKDYLKDLSRLSTLVEYYSRSRQDLKYDQRKYLLVIIEKVLFLIKKLFNMGNQKNRRVKVICKIKTELAHYESCFYKNNFKLDNDVKRILNKIYIYLDRWRRFYEGYIYHAKPISVMDVENTEELMRELKYISLYKHFEKYQEKILKVEELFKILKRKRKIHKDYSFSKFHAELQIMAQQNYINFERFIIQRIFPGELYVIVKSFNRINYNFKLIKTYGMYHVLYVYGNYDNNVIKIGVTKKHLKDRYKKARDTYKSYFPENNFEEIKIIESLNALNLESYLKNKFKQQRHPLFNSTEWFLLTKSDMEYFTQNKYKYDPNFMDILNYELNI
ncbi:GIY-YIG nuclease family protein [Priestia filamentosa]|uniref:GIY-YIG nuclease family protein n=1 Tax=Priestia filamentosa TaxID=1402861 RepID=UPI002E1A432A|nr:hypothetical protein [Priestia filamentosa]